MSRSIWKGPVISPRIIKRSDRKKIFIWARNMMIPSQLIGSDVYVHSGKEFKRLFISREKVGFKFGEFIFTRKYKKKDIGVKNKSKKKK